MGVTSKLSNHKHLCLVSRFGSKDDITSWNVEVTFNKQFTKLSFFNALSDKATGSVFSLDNEAWSGKKKSGDVIAFSLLGDYTDSDPDDPINIESVSLNNVLLC